jgi:hypothetical protein
MTKHTNEKEATIDAGRCMSDRTLPGEITTDACWTEGCGGMAHIWLMCMRRVRKMAGLPELSMLHQKH